MENTRITSWNITWRSGIVALCVLFAVLTIEITKSQSLVLAFDTWFENIIVSIRTPQLSQIFNLITHLGNASVVGSVVALSSIFLVISRKYWTYLAGFFITLSGSVITGYLLKMLIDRPRPGGIIPLITETSGSFPSGHSTISVALYGYLAYLLYVLFPSKRPLILAGVLLLIALIGFSRLYLGVHFPTDVISGYILGSIWLIVGVEVVRRMNSKTSEGT